ncbi:MAG TPA: M23 family metallopeptidase [Acholeplasmataceae bacterium]|nr:M23 family metallopeptidase [Acholeplasmataceae bacterium]
MKRLNKISKEKAQRILFIAVLVLVFGVFFISLSLLNPGENPTPNDPDPPIEEPEEPEVEYETIIAPYKAANIEIIRRFWSQDKEKEIQEMSMFVYDTRYTMSRGISFAAAENENFEVVASLSGIVKEISNSDIYGKVVFIEHEDGLVTEYWSLSEVSVETGDEVAQGDKIGISGESSYDMSAENHIHFRILVNGIPTDPELLIGKAVNEINAN